MNNPCRACWQNCGVEADAEMLEIDRMEDAIAPLDDETAKIRPLITGFELCYHEADKEAEYITKAIGDGRCPKRSNERPLQRKKELEHSRQILSSWCQNPAVSGMEMEVGSICAEELLSAIGPPSPLKIWQVERVIDKINAALDPNRPYHNMVLDLGDYGEPGANPVGDHHQDNLSFVKKTTETVIHDTVDGHEARMSLAMAIDMLAPCNWDFVGSVVTLMKAIGGDLHPERPYVCHQRNLKLSPLCDRVRTISNTLAAFWKEKHSIEDVDANLLAALGTMTPEKRWLAASLDKTVRLAWGAPPDFWLTFS
jgi:hypothetical protein